MKDARLFITFSLLLMLSVSCSCRSADLNQAPDKQPRIQQGLRGIASQLQPGEQPNSTTKQPTGAVPSATQAEVIRGEEDALQARFAAITRTIEELENRISEMRKQASAPAEREVERVDQDIKLLSEELNGISASKLSPLAQIQRNSIQDRLFALEMTMEIARRRWDGGREVFGASFFSSSTTKPASEQRPAPANYKLRVGDSLSISVTSKLGQQRDYQQTIDTAGNIYVAAAGSVSAVGKTANGLAKLINSRISTKFKHLQVAVTVKKLASIQVQVSGAVTRPGVYLLTGMVTVMDALYEAGGPSKSGSFRKVSLVRDGEPNQVVDLYSFLVDGSRERDLALKDGDLVFVPPVGPTIVLDGDVNRPAQYEPIFPITLGAALKMAGGPKPSSYLQTVQVERVENSQNMILLNEPAAAGGSNLTFQLKPGDQITVVPVMRDKTNQVSITGPVKAPGLYGFTEGMRAGDLIRLAQGLSQTQEVYGGRADIIRVDPLKGNEIITFSLDRALKDDPTQNVLLRKLDQVFLYEPDQVVFRPRLVTIAGPVANPGTYKRTEGMRVSDVIAAAGGVLPEAHLERAELLHQNADGSKELIRVDLQKALSGDPLANVAVSDRDEINISSIEQVTWFDHRVRIEGAVQRPGVYARSTNMRLSDLLFECGGLLPEGSKVAEIGRISATGESSILRADLTKLQPSSPEDVLLEDRDAITIAALNPVLRSPELVYITGEVARPGPYTLVSRTEKLTDLIARAGGLTKAADPKGMLFLRQKESFENSQQQNDADLVLKKTRAFADKEFLAHLAKIGATGTEFVKAIQRASDPLADAAEVVADEKLTKDVEAAGSLLEEGKTTPADSTEPASEESTKPEKASAMGPRVAALSDEETMGYKGRQDFATLATSARVSVSLERAFSNSGSPDNIVLRQGDHVYVPRTSDVVTVIGAVLHPHPFAAGPGESVGHYIQRSGGFARDAAKTNVIVVRMNGDALPASQVRSVEPGDMIIVPTTGLIDVTKQIEKVQNVTKVLADILSSAFIITRF